MCHCFRISSTEPGNLKENFITSDNFPVKSLAVVLPTNDEGSKINVFDTLAIYVNVTLSNTSPWKLYTNHVNTVTKYFNQHPKDQQPFIHKQVDKGVTNDPIKILKHSINRRWNLRLTVRLTHLTKAVNISHINLEITIAREVSPILSKCKMNTLE